MSKDAQHPNRQFSQDMLKMVQTCSNILKPKSNLLRIKMWHKLTLVITRWKRKIDIAAMHQHGSNWSQIQWTHSPPVCIVFFFSGSLPLGQLLFIYLTLDCTILYRYVWIILIEDRLKQGKSKASNIIRSPNYRGFGSISNWGCSFPRRWAEDICVLCGCWWLDKELIVLLLEFEIMRIC